MDNVNVMTKKKEKLLKKGAKRVTKKGIFIKKFISTAIVCLIFDIVIMYLGTLLVSSIVYQSGVATRSTLQGVTKGRGMGYAQYMSSIGSYSSADFISFAFEIYDENDNLVIGPKDAIFLRITEENDRNSDTYLLDEKYESLFSELENKYNFDYFSEEGKEHFLIADKFAVSRDNFYPLSVSVTDVDGNVLETVQAGTDIPDGYELYDLSTVREAEIDFVKATGGRAIEMTEDFMKNERLQEGIRSLYQDDFSIELTPIVIDGKGYNLVESIYIDLSWVHHMMLTIMIPVSLVICVIIALIRTKSEYSTISAAYAMEDYRRDMTNKLAHDLKSPLMVISGYAENLCSNVNTDKRDHYAEAILENVKYMDTVIGNTLELSKLETGDISISSESFDAAELCRDIIGKYDLMMEKNGVTALIEGNAPFIADRQQTENILDNLIGNAVKYCDSQGKITVKCSDGRVRVENDCSDAHRIDAESIVKPFIMGDNSRSSRKGSGLGLAIAKAAAERMGMALTVTAADRKFAAEISKK